MAYWRTLVDAHYTAEGNVEHHPNGLLRALDNWIYNAKATKRYRKQGDKWLIENTHFRGQWGISQDNYGRLYYNDNSSNVYGDYFLPGFGAGNADEVNVAGFSERIVADNHVYPIRPTPGINRGYTPGMLDDSLHLVNFTAACAPLVYRGHVFGPQHDNNVFVAEPSANLVKRNIINGDGYITKGLQAYKGKEFLASTDERFRPVNLYNGPDGALYVVDMYRGIIQHKTYLTDYLRREINKRKLTQPVNCGRIYKIVPHDKTLKTIVMPHDAQQLVTLLGDANGWIRDKAQQMLIDGKQVAALPALRQAITSGNNLQAIHALWVLEGLHALETADITPTLNNTEWWVRSQALAVMPSVINKTNYKTYIGILQQYILKSDAQTAPYIAFLYDAVKRYDKPAADNLLKVLAKQYAADKYVADAVISNLNGREAQFKNLVADTNLVFNKHLKTVIAHRVSRLQNHDPVKLQKEFPKGAAIFSSTCQTCHGTDGNGIRMLAPPLNKSQWINGDTKKLLSIVLAGLTGPVEVNGHLYKAPEITADMPGIGASEFSDEDIAQLLSYLRQSWQNNAGKITTAEVSTMRKKLKTREKAFTMEELNRLYPPSGN
jgi:mono/diheme cytochrome c family protein